MSRLFIPVLLGTNRKDRISIHPAKWLVGQMEKRDDIETRLFDVAEFALPQNDYGQGLRINSQNGKRRLSGPMDW